MNYYEAREIQTKEGQPTGLWHYTCKNDGRIWAVGYCSSKELCPDCQGRSGPMWRGDHCDTCSDLGLVHVPNPCQGHATKEEAEEHYRQWELDKETRYDGKLSGQQLQCQLCQAWTQRFARVGQVNTYILCDDHCNRESLEPLVPRPGIVMSSW